MHAVGVAAAALQALLALECLTAASAYAFTHYSPSSSSSSSERYSSSGTKIASYVVSWTGGRSIAAAARRAAVAIDRPPVHDTTYDAIFVPDDEYVESG